MAFKVNFLLWLPESALDWLINVNFGVVWVIGGVLFAIMVVAIILMNHFREENERMYAYHSKGVQKDTADEDRAVMVAFCAFLALLVCIGIAGLSCRADYEIRRANQEEQQNIY